ncbi:MAG: nuclear transport factor 2 family protein [Calditrichia bacterium]
MKALYIFLVWVPLLAAFAAGQKTGSSLEMAQIKSALDAYQKSMETGDLDMLSNIIAHDADIVSFGTDASERWVGWNAMKSSAEQQFASFKNTKLDVHDQVIHIGSGDNVAWFSEIIDMSTTAQGQPIQLKGMRATGVLEKRNGKWLFVQLHHSIGVEGQAVQY